MYSILILATLLNVELHAYWRQHFSYDAVKMMTNPRLYPKESLTVGAYYSNVNGNDGFICDKRDDINQHTADLLCQSLGFSKAENGKETGWFNKSKSHIFII